MKTSAIERLSYHYTLYIRCNACIAQPYTSFFLLSQVQTTWFLFCPASSFKTKTYPIPAGTLFLIYSLLQNYFIITEIQEQILSKKQQNPVFLHANGQKLRFLSRSNPSQHPHAAHSRTMPTPLANAACSVSVRSRQRIYTAHRRWKSRKIYPFYSCTCAGEVKQASRFRPAKNGSQDTQLYYTASHIHIKIYECLQTFNTRL